jgi:SAM-dependent methyltransferase
LNNGNNFLDGKSYSNKTHWGVVKGPIFTSRTWAEYLKMFSLEMGEVCHGKILDCAGGASSFTAHMSGEGCDVVAVDSLYSEDPDVLSDKCRIHMELLADGLASVDSFVWSFFKDIDDLKEQRIQACEEFIRDYRAHRERYVPGDLTDLPFEDDCFDLVLCSHLLFIYDHRLDYDFHLNSIREMVRVSSDELRIYPLVKNRGVKSLYVDRIMSDLIDLDIDILSVDYEFRKGGNEMLVIKK